MSEEQLKNQPQEYLVTDLNDPAEAAIKGMGPSGVAEWLKIYECGRLPLRRPKRKWFQFPRDGYREIDILRRELATLVNAYVVLQSQQSAEQVRGDFYQAYVKQNDELRQFRGFLAEHFAPQLDEGVELNMPLLHVAKKLLLEYKKRI